MTLPAHTLSQSVPASKPLWRATPGLQLHTWGDEFVAYHPLSGDTHLISSVTGHILVNLQQFPLTTHALCKLLASHLEAFDELELKIDSILIELDKLALIERA
jgi:PqqD family protein of HPr-rel-A system